ncbi:hypothetical protein L596_010246 [Steinernema carpocapsae]|uniref:Uncharacterized protein n=1 Tax=Steinernema carpocapsae TaxID=34508 RepID=A0A4U5PII0_STECR|nr:hypothetical protein L596_010246 [Steinernema carpocapsae]
MLILEYVYEEYHLRYTQITKIQIDASINTLDQDWKLENIKRNLAFFKDLIKDGVALNLDQVCIMFSFKMDASKETKNALAAEIIKQTEFLWKRAARSLHIRIFYSWDKDFSAFQPVLDYHKARASSVCVF